MTLVVTACPQRLRGFLTRWLMEIEPGVYVGKVNARIRDALWDITVAEIAGGRAILVYPDSRKEAGFEVRVHRTTWEVVDYEGLALIRRPSTTKKQIMRSGWSKASKMRRARRNRSK
ncbi:type I-E CRISPR-associated endoribonuclease Cas2e [Corynebacterium choanae]